LIFSVTPSPPVRERDALGMTLEEAQQTIQLQQVSSTDTEDTPGPGSSGDMAASEVEVPNSSQESNEQDTGTTGAVEQGFSTLYSSDSQQESLCSSAL